MGVRDDHRRFSRRVTRGPRWRAIRMAVLERDGFRCKSCGTSGRLEVDHIQPVRTNPELSYEVANLQVLCPSCHTRKTRLECGHPALPPDRQDWADAVAELERPAQARRFGFSIPHGVRRSAIPVHLVCGPPGAGKSTLIRERAQPGDLVVDFDVFLKEAGGQKWDTDPAKVKAAFAARDEALRSLERRRGGRAWVIATAPSRAERLAWQAALGRVVITLLDVGPETCKARIRADPKRSHAADKMCAAVDDWWRVHAAEGGVPRREEASKTEGVINA